MARIVLNIPEELLAELKKEAEKKGTPTAGLVRQILMERSWRKKSRKEKQHWLEAIYAGKARRKIRKFEDLFSEQTD